MENAFMLSSHFTGTCNDRRCSVGDAVQEMQCRRCSAGDAVQEMQCGRCSAGDTVREMQCRRYGAKDGKGDASGR